MSPCVCSRWGVGIASVLRRGCVVTPSDAVSHALNKTILYYTILSRTQLGLNKKYYILNYTIHYYTILYYTVLHSTSMAA